MANYYGKTRSNYFRVTDPERLSAIIGDTKTGEDDLELWNEELNNETWYAFGGYSTIIGLKPPCDDGDDDEYDDEPDFASFERALQEILHPEDAIIITEIGNEKLRYLTAYSIIITKDEIASVGLAEHAVQKAVDMLNNPEYRARMDY